MGGLSLPIKVGPLGSYVLPPDFAQLLAGRNVIGSRGKLNKDRWGTSRVVGQHGSYGSVARRAVVHLPLVHI